MTFDIWPRTQDTSVISETLEKVSVSTTLAQSRSRHLSNFLVSKSLTLDISRNCRSQKVSVSSLRLEDSKSLSRHWDFKIHSLGLGLDVDTWILAISVSKLEPWSRYSLGHILVTSSRSLILNGPLNQIMSKALFYPEKCTMSLLDRISPVLNQLGCSTQPLVMEIF